MTQSTGKQPTTPRPHRRLAGTAATAPPRVLLAPVPDAGGHRAPAQWNPLPPLEQVRSDIELVQLIHARIRPLSSRRVGLPHAAMLRTLDRMEAGAGDVPSIYKALLDSGQTMVMSKVYRVLKVLEEAGLVERRWMLYDGRPRSEYRIVRG